MQIVVIAVGKLKEKYWKEAQAEYLKRLLSYASLSMIEVADEADDIDPSRIQQIEGLRILSKLKERDYVIALDVRGDTYSSEQFADQLQSVFSHGHGRYVFLIGGSHGFSTAVLERSQMKFSMSKLTFPHQMARIILLEQIYRSFRISSGSPYHK
ncbi:23S rRNA (pseudouridine(1915)-N(3))-methyltransferase RlmH [Sulfoacidibacillus ferrooxidans]|uniref:Ribosomal RNA large subunit methyltransferase H n=1 Tax=Sulfoacidibacillus ferrooxidans TaxID=2005001 RepID=A0A9X1VAT7_9BACL|nr:Ribosomal RNA large subunit methyltransferase H [Sulfoacidibacillus ferrooxidans]